MWFRLIMLALACAASSLIAGESASFRNGVMAVLSKAGCNAGACHGNANGKGGFKLSLRGESPELDLLALTVDQFNRRVDFIAPEESLILLKATAQLAHEGGERFKKDSWEYRTLLSWLQSGATNDLATAPKLTRLEVTPLESYVTIPARETAADPGAALASVQLAAKAFFSDGSSRDVTGQTVYEPAHTIVQVNPAGLVECLQPGETTVLARFLDQQAPARIAFIPARPDFVWSNPVPKNYIDRLVFDRLKKLRMNPSELCSDTVFVRRAYLDLLGLLPTTEEARAFVYDVREDKRRRLIDELLERPEFADFWALKWSDLLRNEERILDRKGSELFHRWVRESILHRKPLDQFVSEIIAARGSTYANPPANFYRAARSPVERGEAAAQLFLGVRVQCAQCHNHPFDRWSQDDYYDWMSVFSRVQYKVLENRRRDDNDGHEFKGEQIVYTALKGSFVNARTGGPASPRFLGAAEPLKVDEDQLSALARWVTSPDNPFFARVQANRVWFHLMGRGVVDPIDDFRASNPPSNPELLDALAKDFINHGFDLRQLIRTIMNSAVYQLSSSPNDTNSSDENNFSRSLVRRLSAEQLLDCQFQAAGVSPKFPGYPEGTRAVQLASALPERRRGSGKAEVEEFLVTFGKPARLLPSECERSSEPAMAQAFQLMSGPIMQELLSVPDNRIKALLEKALPDAQLVSELYWTTLSREPSPAESATLLKHLQAAEDKRAALEDILWALMNSKEFIFR